MAFDEKTVDRVRDVLVDQKDIREVKMMGALIFMVNGHMCCGVKDKRLMVRIGSDAHAAALKRPHVRPFDVGAGRQPKAFIHVEPDGIATRSALARWIDEAVSFVGGLPPKMKTTKKKRAITTKKAAKKAAKKTNKKRTKKTKRSST